jgi:hypothetical protein
MFLKTCAAQPGQIMALGIPAISNCPVCDVGKSAPYKSHVPVQQIMIQPQQQLLLSKLFFNSIHKSSYTCFTLWSICEFIFITLPSLPNIYNDIMGGILWVEGAIASHSFWSSGMLEMLSYHFFPFGSACTYSSPGLQA